MKKMIAIGLAASAAVLAVTPFASGHATVSLLQPQGRALTSARVAYVLRAPNEKANQDTILVTMHVPEAAQESISVKQTPDWTVVLKKRRDRPGRRRGQPPNRDRAGDLDRAQEGHADRARHVRRVVVPDAEPGDAAAALLRDRPVVLEEDGRRQARGRQVERRLGQRDAGFLHRRGEQLT